MPLTFIQQWLLIRLLANALRFTGACELSIGVRRHLCLAFVVEMSTLARELRLIVAQGTESGFWAAFMRHDFTQLRLCVSFAFILVVL